MLVAHPPPWLETSYTQKGRPEDLPLKDFAQDGAQER